MRRFSRYWLLLAALLMFVSGCSGGNGGDADAGGNGADESSDAGTDDGNAPDEGASIPYVASDFYAAVVVQPRNLVESKLAAKMLKRPNGVALPPDVTDMLENAEKGKQIDQVMILVGPGMGDPPAGIDKGFGPPMPNISAAMIMHFTSADAANDMFAEATVGEERSHGAMKYNLIELAPSTSVDEIRVPTEDAEAQLTELKQDAEFADPNVRITYKLKKSDDGETTTIMIETKYVNDDPFTPNARYMPDDKTAVLAREEMLKKMLDAKEATSPLIERLQPLLGKHDLVALAVGETVREPAKQMAEMMMPPMVDPAQAQDFVKLLDGITAVTLTAGADADPLLKVSVETDDPAAAKAIHEKLDPLLKFAQGMTAMASQAGDKPHMKDHMKVAGDLVGGLALKQDGQQVSLTAARPGSLDGVEDWLGPIAQEFQESMRKDRLRQIAFAMLEFMDIQEKLPGNAYPEEGDAPVLSWRVAILPHLGQLDLHGSFHLDEAWDSDHNKPLLEADGDFGEPNPYTGATGAKPGYTTYLSFQGAGAMIDGKKQKTFDDLKDPFSGTIAIVEVSVERAVPWTQPVDIDFSGKDVKSILGPPPSPEGYPAAMFDGRVITLPADIDVESLKKLIGFDNGIAEGFDDGVSAPEPGF